MCSALQSPCGEAEMASWDRKLLNCGADKRGTARWHGSSMIFTKRNLLLNYGTWKKRVGLPNPGEHMERQTGRAGTAYLEIGFSPAPLPQNTLIRGSPQPHHFPECFLLSCHNLFHLQAQIQLPFLCRGLTSPTHARGRSSTCWLCAAVPGLCLFPPDTACLLPQPPWHSLLALHHEPLPTVSAAAGDGTSQIQKLGSAQTQLSSPETHPPDMLAPHMPAPARPVPMLSVPASQITLYPSQSLLQRSLSMILP